MQGKDTKRHTHSTFLVLPAFNLRVICSAIQACTYHWRAPNKICLSVRLPVSPSARKNSRRFNIHGSVHRSMTQ